MRYITSRIVVRVVAVLILGWLASMGIYQTAWADEDTDQGTEDPSEPDDPDEVVTSATDDADTEEDVDQGATDDGEPTDPDTDGTDTAPPDQTGTTPEPDAAAATDDDPDDEEPYLRLHAFCEDHPEHDDCDGVHHSSWDDEPDADEAPEPATDEADDDDPDVVVYETTTTVEQDPEEPQAVYLSDEALDQLTERIARSTAVTSMGFVVLSVGVFALVVQGVVRT